jgi:hypothetical protein
VTEPDQHDQPTEVHTELIGDGRGLKVCDVCGGVDDHPRHSFLGTVGGGDLITRPAPEIVDRVINMAPLDQRARLVAELLDTTTTDRHPDCCRTVGCPTGDCDRLTAGAEHLRGAELVDHLARLRADGDEPGPGGAGVAAAASALSTLGLLLALWYVVGLFTRGLSATNLANAWLATMRGGGNGVTFTAPAALYVQLHTGDPGASGTANVSSVTTRQAITFGAPSGGSMALSNTPTWSNWAGTNGEVETDISEWSATTAGTFYDSAQLTVSKTVNIGDTISLSSYTKSAAPIAA